MEQEPYIEAHKLSINNKSIILASERCGCFYCKRLFRPDQIIEWVTDKMDETAMCPFCHIDSVIPETDEVKLDENLLQEMRDYWFPPR